jgi:phospholipase C
VLGARALLEGKAGDGLTASMSNPDSSGASVAPWQGSVPTMCVPDPPHSWSAAHAQFNGGAMDGFLTTYQQDFPGDLGAMQYAARVDMPVTWALADAYATCDRWFSSVMGPTFPNRYYWLAGTSMGVQSNVLPSGGFTHPTVFGRMKAAGIDFGIYYSDIPFISLMGDIDIDPANYLETTEQFFHDAAAGELPSVSYVDPPFSNADDHPPHHPILGQQFLASVYNALASSPQWERSLLVITYDEHGGFFDHVPPPTSADDYASTGFNQLGIRVPAIIVGPYVKQGFVSSVARDHTSALKQIENMFGTAPLSARTTAATDLSELIDTARLAKGDAAEPVTVPTVQPGQWVIDASCDGASFRRPDHDVLREFHDRFGAHSPFDRRTALAQTMRAIAAQSNAGAVRSWSPGLRSPAGRAAPLARR